jgi:hypothetical protein
MKAHEETEMETSSEATSPQGGAASRGPRHGVEPLGSIFYSFSSHDFSYLIKTIKV